MFSHPVGNEVLMSESVFFPNMFPDYEPPEVLNAALSRAAIVAADIDPATRRVSVAIHSETYIPGRLLDLAAKEIACIRQEALAKL